MNIVDIIILIILLINSISGLTKGFIVSVFNLLGLLLSFFIAKNYYEVIANYIKETPSIYTKILDFVNNRVYGLMEGMGNSKADSFFDIFKLPKPIKELMINSEQFRDTSTETVSSLNNFFVGSLTDILINIISFILAFFIAWGILQILIGLLDLLAHLPIIKQFNRMLGFGFGLIKGILIIFLLFALITPVVTMYSEGLIAKSIFDSNIGYYFYSNNIIIEYFKTSGFLTG
ncbi:MAG: CvpA family protein [Firmicutes bacterium]|nr:CvpA family protein [Bacillota bacterium]